MLTADVPDVLKLQADRMLSLDPNVHRLTAYLRERERSAPPTAQPKRYQRRKVGHTRPLTSRLAWRRVLCG